MSRWLPPNTTWGELLHTIAFFVIVFGGGTLLVFYVTWPRWPVAWVFASIIAYQWAAVLLYSWWMRGAIKPPSLTRGTTFRSFVFVAVLISGGTLVLHNWPGGAPLNFVAAAAYACVVTALRIAVWGWRD